MTLKFEISGSLIKVTETRDDGGISVDFFAGDKLSYHFDPVNSPSSSYHFDDAVMKKPYKSALLSQLRGSADQTFATDQDAQDYLDDILGSGSITTYAANSVLAQDNSAISTRSTDFKYEVALGLRTGYSTVNKFGFNLDIDTATPEIIASFGGSFDPKVNVITTAQTFTITYNNTTDGSAATGARSLLFTYLDENFLEQTAVHTLGNTGSDVTSFTGLGINRCLVLSNGGLGWNANDITVTATTDGTTQAQIPALTSVTQQLIYHTPISSTFLDDFVYFKVRKLSGGGGSPRVTVRGYSWSRVTLTRYDIYEDRIDTSTENRIAPNFKQPLIFTGREVIYFEAETDTNNTSVSGRFSGILNKQ